MKQKNLLILAAVTIAAIAAAALTLRGDGGASASSAAGMLFPELGEHINDIARIEIEKAGETATLAQRDGEWTLADRGGYPALFEKVKELAVLVSDLEIEEAKTAKKANHARLGVEWPPSAEEEAEPGAEASKVTFQDASGATLASVVIGKSEWRGSKPKVYARRAGEDQVYLCAPRGQINVTTSATSWLKTKFVELPNERVQRVKIEHHDGEVVDIARSVTNHTQFAVQNLPPGQVERHSGVANGVAQALGYGLTLEDVRPAGDVDFTQDPLATTTFRTHDGLVLALDTARFDDKTWVKVRASYIAPPEDETAPAADEEGDEHDGHDHAEESDEPEVDVEAEVAELNERLSPWAFAVGTYKTDVLARRMKDLVPEAEAPADDAELQELMDSMGGLDGAPTPDGLAPEEGGEAVEPAGGTDDEESAPAPAGEGDPEPE